jgi:hypothetical protein
MANKSMDQSLAFNAEGGSISRTKENYINAGFVLTPKQLNSPFLRTLNSVEGSRKWNQAVAPISESIPNAELSE